MKKDNNSHIFKHLHSSATCFESYNSIFFKIIDMANSKFDLIIKEALPFNWRKPNLNAQQKYLALTLLLQLLLPLLLCIFFCFLFVVFSISLSSISTLIIGTFCCLNYILLLFHLFITHLVIDFIITIQLAYVLGSYNHLYKCR